MGAAVNIFLAVHLIQGLLVWGARANLTANHTAKDQPMLVRPPHVDKFNAEDILNYTKGLAAMHLPLKSTGSCHVTIGGHNFSTVSDEPTVVAETPAHLRRLRQTPSPSPPTNYNWPAMGAVEVWTTKDLVQALLVGNPTIIVAADLDISEAVPLPVIIFRVTIMGVCPNGTYCKLDAKGMNSIFLVAPGGYLTLKDLDIRNGYCAEGGAIQVSGVGSTNYIETGLLVALNVDFYNNSASARGGAIYMPGGSAGYFEGCIFYLNSAPMGGAVYIGGAQPIAASSTSAAGDPRHDKRVTTSDEAPPGCDLTSCTSVVDSLFFLNWANEGGAVYVEDATKDCVPDETWGPGLDSWGGSIDIVNAHFENNTAIKGGGIYMQYKGSGTYTQTQDTTFSKNIADHGGDILVASEGSNINGSYLFAFRTEFDMRNSMFVEWPQTGSFSDCTFNDNEALNCTEYCNLCPSTASKHSSVHLPSPRHQVIGRSKRHAQWTNTQNTPCPTSLGFNVCGWIPDECGPPPSPPAPPPTVY